MNEPLARLTPLTDAEVDVAAKELDDDIDFLAGFQRGVEFAECRHGVTPPPTPALTYAQGWKEGYKQGDTGIVEAIAEWLEGQGQPGYAHEVRHREWPNR